jgi:hypothetical protein
MFNSESHGIIDTAAALRAERKGLAPLGARSLSPEICYECFKTVEESKLDLANFEKKRY